MLQNEEEGSPCFGWKTTSFSQTRTTRGTTTKTTTSDADGVFAAATFYLPKCKELTVRKKGGK